MQPKIIENFISKETSYQLKEFFEEMATINPKKIKSFTLNSKNLGDCIDPKNFLIIDMVNLISKSIESFLINKNKKIY